MHGDPGVREAVAKWREAMASANKADSEEEEGVGRLRRPAGADPRTEAA